MSADNDPHATQMQELTALWMQAQPTVEAFIATLLPSFQDADDILQQVALDIASRFEKYDRNKPFLAWAIAIAKLKVIDLFRKRGREKHVFVGQSIDDIANAYVQLEPELPAVETALKHCMEKLQPRSRKLLEMRYTDDMKPAGIAEKLDTSANSVSVTLNRIRSSLSNCIEKRLASETTK